MSASNTFFGRSGQMAADRGIHHIAHGANVDDLGDYRPGYAAAREMGIEAPLIDAGLTKADIRSLSRRMGLETWDKPAMACLATRIPYGTPVTAERLRQVGAGRGNPPRSRFRRLSRAVSWGGGPHRGGSG